MKPSGRRLIVSCESLLISITSPNKMRFKDNKQTQLLGNWVIIGTGLEAAIRFLGTSSHVDLPTVTGPSTTTPLAMVLY